MLIVCSIVGGLFALICLFLLIVHPLICMFECVISKEISGGRKVMWLLATFFTGVLGSLAYAFLGTRSPGLRRYTLHAVKAAAGFFMLTMLAATCSSEVRQFAVGALSLPSAVTAETDSFADAELASEAGEPDSSWPQETHAETDLATTEELPVDEQTVALEDNYSSEDSATWFVSTSNADEREESQDLVAEDEDFNQDEPLTEDLLVSESSQADIEQFPVDAEPALEEEESLKEDEASLLEAWNEPSASIVEDRTEIADESRLQTESPGVDIDDFFVDFPVANDAPRTSEVSVLEQAPIAPAEFGIPSEAGSKDSESLRGSRQVPSTNPSNLPQVSRQPRINRYRNEQSNFYIANPQRTVRNRYTGQ